jgi:predicted transcriptional regulator
MTLTIDLDPESEKQLLEMAERNGRAPEALVTGFIAEALTWEHQDDEATLEAIRQGMADVEAGRVKSLAQVIEDHRAKYGSTRQRSDD